MQLGVAVGQHRPQHAGMMPGQRLGGTAPHSGQLAAALGGNAFLVPIGSGQSMAAQSAAVKVPLPEPQTGTAPVAAASAFHSAAGSEPPRAEPGRVEVAPIPSDPAGQKCWVEGLCRNAFAFVDAQQTGKVNASECRMAIIDVLQKILSSDPDVFEIPSNAWFAQAFKNFDEDKDGLINRRQFTEIVIQFYDHKQKKRSNSASQVSKAVASSAPVSNALKDSTATATTDTSPGCRGYPERERKGSTSSSRNPAAKVDVSVMFPQHAGKLKVFEDYEFLGSAGSGSFGQVLMVKHLKSGTIRACKRIPVETPMERELVETEINLLRQLDHPNIMRFFESYGDARGQSGTVYLMVELCQGGDLFSRILHHYQHIKTPMTEAQVGYYIAQILSALHYCHTRSPSPIIHRDLKPENVLFLNQTARSPLKVIDFGLANSRHRLYASAKEIRQPKGGIVGWAARALPITIGSKPLFDGHTKRKQMQRAGTAPYMAPEMIEGEYDENVDIFSAGVILYQLLTGKNPFYEIGIDDEKRVREKISSPAAADFPAQLWADVTQDAQDLTRKMLEKNPSRRITAAAALSHHWIKDPAKPQPFGNRSGLSASIFEGLQRYQFQNKLKRAVMQLLAKDLSEFEIQDLRKKFLALDTKGDGMLSAKALAQGIKDLGYDMPVAELDSIMAALDTGGDPRERCISYNEFIAALMERRVRIDRQKLLELFNRLGGEEKGRISLEDAQKALRGTPSQVGITASEFNALPGVSSDGTLDFEQFCELFEAEPPQAGAPSRGSSANSTSGGTPGSKKV